MNMNQLVVTGIIIIVVIYMIRQMSNGWIDRITAFLLTRDQLHIASDPTKQNAQVVPPAVKIEPDKEPAS